MTIDSLRELDRSMIAILMQAPSTGLSSLVREIVDIQAGESFDPLQAIDDLFAGIASLSGEFDSQALTILKKIKDHAVQGNDFSGDGRFFPRRSGTVGCRGSRCRGEHCRSHSQHRNLGHGNNSPSSECRNAKRERLGNRSKEDRQLRKRHLRHTHRQSRKRKSSAFQAR